MQQTVNSVVRSLRIWHIVPLCLPFLLGSTTLRTPVQTSTAVAVLPPSLSHLFSSKDLSTAHQLTLPSKTLTSLSTPPLRPQTPLPAAAKPISSPARKPLQTSSPQPDPHPAAARIAKATDPQPAKNLPPIPIRVAIATEAKTIALATSDAGIVVDANGHAIGQLTAQLGITVTPNATGLQIGSWSAPAVAWIKPTSTDGLVYADGHWYRGAVQLVAQGDHILAINHVDVESYLYSVVGAEMPSYWSIEALKAQAIAARSYAIVHLARPANDLYDLGATPRWQAYSGAETETETTHAAVNATRGMLLSYQGGVVESLYAASSQLVQEAHGGYGMSQEGANQLAQQQSFDYLQILGHFYPGTGLAVLNIQ